MDESKWSKPMDAIKENRKLSSPSISPRHRLAAANNPRSMTWAQALASYVGDGAQLNSHKIENEIEEHLLKSMADRDLSQNGASAKQMPSIPTFFTPKPAPDSLKARTQRLARLKFLQKQTEKLLSASELETLWATLHSHRTLPPDPATSDRINYDDFKRASGACKVRIGEKCERFFTAAVFLTFEADDFGRIPILPLYLYIMRWVSLTQTRIDMSILDQNGDGCLSPEELEAYVGSVLPTLRGLRGPLPPSFAPIYCRIAARKLLFFCDPQRRGKVVIRDVLLSPVLSELMELTQEAGSESTEVQADNWFSMTSARHVYQTFLALDVDKSGGLSCKELSAVCDRNLTDIFIHRVFEEHVGKVRTVRGARAASNKNKSVDSTPSREMGFAAFVDLLLALDHKNTPEGLAYLFQCMDLQGRGYLTAADVYTLFRSVHKRWVDGGNYELAIEDVKDEIWDMVRPRDPLCITLEDLLECRQGGTVAAMLIDSAAFWAHDNRENLAAQQD